MASDTNIDLVPYQTQVDANFRVVRDWYSGQLGGKTFNLQSAIVYRSPKTSLELHAQWGSEGGIWYEGIKEATAAKGLNICDNHIFYYFITPLDDIWGGMVGAENLGCPYVLHGTASIPSQMGRLIGGIINPNWPEWWANEPREAQGGVAHELAHGFGGSCTGLNIPGGQCDFLAHNTDWDADSIMLEWWLFGNGGVLTSDEKTKILQSPFIL